MKALLYCTKNGRPLIYKAGYNGGIYLEGYIQTYNVNKEYVSKYIAEILNGTIVAECEINKIEEIKFYTYDNDRCDISDYCTDTIDDIEEKSCLEFNQLYDYIGYNKSYALHLENVKEFDTPKKLTDYFNNQKEPITKAPQNMMYAYDNDGNQYALISIRPEWLCKILNGEKTIEVRKKVLKEIL